MSGPGGGGVCLHLCNEHTCTRIKAASPTILMSFCFLASLLVCMGLSEPFLDAWPCRANMKESTPSRAGATVVRKSGLRGAFCCCILRTRTMESDKNCLQILVTKSPFPLKGPSNLKIPCKAPSHSILRSLPRARWALAPYVKEVLETRGLVPPLGFYFFLAQQVHCDTVYITFFTWRDGERRGSPLLAAH